MEGLELDGTLSFKDGDEEEGFPAAADGGPQVRKAVDAGTDVIDITALRAQLEQRGGEPSG